MTLLSKSEVDSYWWTFSLLVVSNLINFRRQVSSSIKEAKSRMTPFAECFWKEEFVPATRIRYLTSSPSGPSKRLRTLHLLTQSGQKICGGFSNSRRTLAYLSFWNLIFLL